MAEFDLVIRGGELLDGRGGPAVVGDVAIREGRIAEIGRVSGRGREEIDARGRLVTPGFVDIHTHYDGQATWSGRFDPSSAHGTTTVVMGNCSVGFAPVRPADHDTLIDLMEGVEDIPNVAMQEGLRWNWSSFPEYLDAADAIPHDIDFAAQLPHAAMRLYVMGERALRHEAATPADIATMRAITAQAMRAGAFGVSTSRTPVHRAASGNPILSLNAEADELLGIAEGIRDGGGGVIEAISDWSEDRADDFAIFHRLVKATGVPLSLSVSQHVERPERWRRLLGELEAARAEGLPMTGQVAARAIGTILGLQSNHNPFAYFPSYRRIAAMPLAEKVAALRDSGFRQALMNEAATLENPMEANRHKHYDVYDTMFPIGERPDYEPDPSRSVAAIAVRRGVSPLEVICDHLLSEDGRGLIYQPIINFQSRDLSVSREMLASRATVPGIGDGGAHVGLICDASNTTFMLTHWGRDRPSGRFDLGWLVKRQTHDTAAAVGLHDRGLLLPGLKADVNVIDFDRLAIERPYMAYDLPAGGKRLLQKARGYDATVVSGVLIARHDEPTGARPGRLVRRRAS